MVGRRLLAALCAVLTLVLAREAPAAAPAQRIVSLNLCTDQVLIDLVPRDRIAALSWVAGDRNVSAIADEIGGIRLVRGAAEEILALEPDLVIAGDWTTPATVDLLRRIGRRVEVVTLAQDFAGIRHAIRQMAAAVGEPERGEAVVARFDRKLGALPPPPSHPLSVLAYQVNGLVSGPATLFDEMLKAAGMVNQAERLDLGPGGRIALESLISDPPDIVVLAQAPGTYRTPVAENLRHPALTSLLRKRPSVVLPMPYWLCGTPRVADATEALAAARIAADARIGR